MDGMSMGAVRLLWIDLCTQPDVHGLFQLVPTKHHAVRIDRFEDLVGAVHQLHPQLASIEFDYPDKARLQAVPVLARALPEVPLLMFTEYHSEALAVWAFRSGVSDYRVKPITRTTLVRSIEALSEIAASGSQNRPPAPWLPADLIEPAGYLQSPPSTSQKTGAAVAYIAQHFAQDLKRDAVADLSHVSPSKFSRVFRREQGVSFKHFVLAYRIAKARDFLTEPNMSISLAAYSVGISDVSYFSRVFRRLVGITATEYQQRVRPRRQVPLHPYDGSFPQVCPATRHDYPNESPASEHKL